MSDVKIRVRDVNEQFVGIVDKFIEATFIPRWNGIGTWTIKAAVIAPNVKHLVPGCGINVVLPDGSDFSGHATDFLDEWDMTDENSGDGTITITGVEDKAILGYRVILPDPTADYTLQSAAATYSQSGPIETLIKNLVRDNMGDRSLATRRLPNLYVKQNFGAGPTTTISARYDNLLDQIQRLASPVGFGFSMVSVPGGWFFDCRAAVDVSADVRFSRSMGNMTGYKFGRTAPKVTRNLVAGAGVGTARNVLKYDQLGGAVDPVWGFMIEQLIDARQTNSSTDMLQASMEAFASGGEQVALSASVVDTPRIQIGRDYGLGSVVSMEVRDAVYSDIVSEISYTFKPNEQRIVPTIGGADAVYGKALDVYRVVRSISARLALLERRY